MTTILFFDDLRLSQRENAHRRIGRPRLIPESVYRDPQANTAWGYPCVFRDLASGLWRMLYQGLVVGPQQQRRHVPLVAESADGLRWTPRPTTDIAHIADRWADHQVLPMDQFGEWSTGYVDNRADPSERIKAFAVHALRPYHLGSRLWVSPDGLRWTLKEGVHWQKQAPDPAVSVFWNAVRRSYTFTTRPEFGDRRVAVFETKDWQSFGEPELALQADALDTPLAEIYGMPVLPYEGYYIGLVWVYHVRPQVSVEEESSKPWLWAPHKYYYGPVDVQLAYSLNGWHFQRGLREPFIANGEPGQPDGACVYPSCAVTREDGSLWIYASACTHEHAFTPDGSGSIVAYQLRRDGFVYLESGGGEATIGTRGLHWNGGDLQLNLQCPCGTARVQITDPAGAPLPGFSFAECAPLAGDDTAWQPQWQNGRGMSELAGQVVRVEVRWLNGRLYALRGDFLPLVGCECARWRDLGETPQPRLGF